MEDMLKLKDDVKKMELDEVMEYLFWRDIYLHNYDGYYYLIDCHNNVVYSTYSYDPSIILHELEYYEVDENLRQEVLENWTT
jgi:hypothetical protein